MESTLKIRQLTFNLNGDGLVPIALSLYQALAELLSEHPAVRVTIDHGRDGDRGVTRMILTPPDVELQIRGDSSNEVEPIDSIVDGLKEGFAEQGRVVIVNLNDVLDNMDLSSPAGD